MTPLQQQQKASWEDEIMEGFTESTPDLILYVVRREIARTREQTLLEVEAGIETMKLIEVSTHPERLLQKQFYNNALGRTLNYLRTLREGITGNEHAK